MVFPSIKLTLHRLYFCLIIFLMSSIISSCEDGRIAISDNDYPTVNYTGSTQKATLTRQNSILYVDVVYSLLEPIYHLSSAIFYVPLPTLLNYEELNGGEECTEGSLSVVEKDQGNEVIATYANCIIDGVTTNGEIIYSIENNTPVFEGQMNIVYLSLKNGDELTTLAGDATVNAGGLSVNKLTVFSDKLATGYFTTDLNILDNGDVSGSIYQSEFGSVDISYLNDDSTLILSGTNNTTLKAVHYNLNFFTGKRPYKFFLSYYEDSNLPENSLTTEIPLLALFKWPYDNNSAPVASVGENISTDRLAPLNISGELSVDLNYDFLSYTWRHITAPANCTFSLSGTEGINVDFLSECEGLHQLELSVFDGFSTSINRFDVNVVPLQQI